MKLLNNIALLLSSVALTSAIPQPLHRQDQMVIGADKPQEVKGKDTMSSALNPQTYQPDSLRLLSLSEDHAEWANPEEFISAGKKFVDVTDHAQLSLKADEVRESHTNIPLPKTLRYQNLVKSLLEEIDIERVRERLTKFTSFHNRYYRSKTGVESAQWLESTLSQIIASTGAQVSVRRFDHAWDQFSLIARFEPRHYSRSKEPTVIVGAHQDTTRGGMFGDGRAPGADDDGSGSMTTLEAFTILCESGYEPTRPVEFHWYSAEEVGLRGSQDVAAAYQRDSRKVMGMLHFDMTGYGKKDVYGIITDYTDPGLTSYLRLLAKNYGTLPMVDTKCNYGCSDHASWTKAGFRAAFPFEGEFKDSSPFIHGKQDTVENIDFEHLSEFVKLAISFAVELGEPEVTEDPNGGRVNIQPAEKTEQDLEAFLEKAIALGSPMGVEEEFEEEEEEEDVYEEWSWYSYIFGDWEDDEYDEYDEEEAGWFFGRLFARSLEA